MGVMVTFSYKHAINFEIMLVFHYLLSPSHSYPCLPRQFSQNFRPSILKSQLNSEKTMLSVFLRLAYFMVTFSSAYRPASDMILFFFMTVTLHYQLLDFWWCQEEAAMSLFGQRLEDWKSCWMSKRDQLSRWSTGWGNFSQSTHAVQGDREGRYLASISLHWPPARYTLPADAVLGVFWNPFNLL